MNDSGSIAPGLFDGIGAGEAVIRLYRPADRPRVRAIAVETGFRGAVRGRAVCDPELLADVLTAYYTDREPEHVLVAEEDGRVIGYILGTVSPLRFVTGSALLILTRVLPALLFGRYRLRWRCVGVLAAALTGILNDEHTPSLDAYPAHLHINITDGQRSHGLGSRLIAAWLGRLRRTVRGVHCSTLVLNPAAVRFFMKNGFSPYHTHRSTLWRYVTGNRSAGVAILVRTLRG